MKKIRFLGFMVFAVCALSAVVVSAAFASEWLVEGLSLANGTLASAESEGELELKAYAASAPSSLVLTIVLCSGIFDGSVTWPNLDLVTDLLTLDSVTTIGELGMENTTPLSCEVSFDDGEITDCKVGLVEVTVDNLNLELGLSWETELLLPAENEWIDHFPATSGYDVRCESLVTGVFGENLCEGAVHALMSNDTTTMPASILGEFMSLAGSEATELERATCTLTGATTGEVVGSGHTWVVEGELMHLETAVS